MEEAGQSLRNPEKARGDLRRTEETGESLRKPKKARGRMRPE